MLVSKAQLLLGPSPLSPTPKSTENMSNSKDHSVGQDGDAPLYGSKYGGGKKRKTPPTQILNASLAKYSRRSTRLHKNSSDQTKIVDFVDSSKEYHTTNEIKKFGERGISFKVLEPDPIEKGHAKGLDGTQTLKEELQCHLKVLNGLGISLSTTCTCINILTLEITNYLKEVIKDLSATKEQQNPIGK
eukprot:Gb_32126 [translate_table: standard]